MKILIVDDQQTNLLLMAALVRKLDESEPFSFSDPRQAIDWCRQQPPDLVLLDYMMPELDGLQFLQQFRKLPNCQDVPLLMITADHQKSLRYRALELSASDFLTKPIDKVEFLARARNMLQLRQSQLDLMDRAAWLTREVTKATATLRQREQETINKLSNAAEFRDPETGAHIQRMALFAEHIAINLGQPERERDLLVRASPMHDIGKVGIPDQILLKPGQLDAEEYRIIQQHASIGYQILKGSSSQLLQLAAEIAYTHHERYDGSGYPRGLAEEAIPLSGRICAIADVFDALISVRPYKPAWSITQGLAMLKECRGSHFDPACIDAFLGNFARIEEIVRLYGEAEESDSP